MSRVKKINQIKENRKKTNIILFILLVLGLVGISSYVFLKSRNVDFSTFSVKEWLSRAFSDGSSQEDSTGQKTREHSYDASEHPVFSVLDGTIVKCNVDSIRGFSASGEEQWVSSINANNPLLKTEGPYLAVADIGGRNLSVFYGKEKKWERKTENPITTVSINKDGYVCAVQESEGLKNTVTVFDASGNEIFTRGKAESFVTQAKISPSSDQVLLSCIDTTGITVSSSLEFTDIYGKAFANIRKENVITTAVWYLKNNSFFTVHPEGISFYDENRTEKWGKSIESITSSALTEEKYLVVAVKEAGNFLSGNSSKLMVFNDKGEVKESEAFQEEIKSMEAHQEIVAVNTGRELFFFDTAGKRVGRYSAKSDIIDMKILSRDRVLVVNKNSFQVVPIAE